MRNLRQIWQLLSSSDRLGGARVLVLMLIGAVLELLGVGLVVPVLAMLADPSAQGWMSRYMVRWLGVTEPSQMAVTAMFLLVGVYLLKSLFISAQLWGQQAFSSGVQQRLCLRLYRLYLNQPYSFHLKRNSAMLIRNITQEANMLVSCITGFIQIATELLVIVAMVGLLLWYEPIGALFLVALFMVAGGSFYAISKGATLRWGKARQFHEGHRVKQLHQGLGGVKDAILLGCQEVMVRQFDKHNFHSLRASRMQSTLQQYPRLWLEFISILGLAIIVISSVSGGKGDITSLVPTLGLFAVAAIRMIPSANRLLTSLQAIRFGSPSVERLHAELTQLNMPPSSHPQRSVPGAFKYLRFEQVDFIYEGAKSYALKNINMSVSHGEVIGIMGASGSGKSTMIDLMLGLLSPSHGKILVDGADVSVDPEGWRLRVGYVPQSIYLMDDTLRRNIAFGCEEDEIDDIAVEASIDMAQLRYLVGDLVQGVNTVLGERGIRLSGGQRQRIGIARALYRNPSVLVLDEATSALDTETETAVMEAVNALRGSKTVIIVAHRLSTLKSCDRIYRLSAGKIVAEGPPSLMLVESSPGASGDA